jgi:hypothetical protein
VVYDAQIQVDTQGKPYDSKKELVRFTKFCNAAVVGWGFLVQVVDF